MYGFLVFAGQYVLLALFPRHYPGVWELVIFHKVAMSVTATLVGAEAADAQTVAMVDGILAAITIAAYFLASLHGRGAFPPALVRICVCPRDEVSTASNGSKVHDDRTAPRMSPTMLERGGAFLRHLRRLTALVRL